MPQVKVVVECHGGEIELLNFVLPTLYHYIKVTTRNSDGSRKSRTEKVYQFSNGQLKGKDEAYWTTYRYQLEAFIDRLKGRTPQTWVTKEDSIANMEWIENIYAKVRPLSAVVILF